jgi:hypothetical protein
MATLRKRNGKWQAQARRRGHPGITRTFIRKSDAQSWARQQELQADQIGSPIRHRAPRDLMVADILTRYRNEVVPRKRGAANEVCIINAFLRRPIAQVSVVDPTTGMVSADYTERLRCVKVASANRELDILRHAFGDWDHAWRTILGPIEGRWFPKSTLKAAGALRGQPPHNVITSN